MRDRHTANPRPIPSPVLVATIAAAAIASARCGAPSATAQGLTPAAAPTRETADTGLDGSSGVGRPGAATPARPDAGIADAGAAYAGDPSADLANLLHPSPGSWVLLLGVHVEVIKGYGPMFSAEGKPETDVRPGYRTVVYRMDAGKAEVVGELPFLVLPQESGFLFVGESSVREHLPDDPKVKMFDGTPMPRTYDATELWMTRDRRAIAQVDRKLLARLRAARKWGAENTTQALYLTRRAICTVNTESQVTGGALYFTATTRYRLAAVSGPPLSDNLFRYVDEPGMRKFAAGVYDMKEEEVDFDRPYVDNFLQVSLRDDVYAVLDHAEATVMLEGAVLRPANSARSFMESRVVGPAPPTLAPGNERLDFAAITRAIPGSVDALVSPGHDIVVGLRPHETPMAVPDAGTDDGKKPVIDEMAVYDVGARKVFAKLAVPGRPVMVEWASAEEGTRWISAIGLGAR